MNGFVLMEKSPLSLLPVTQNNKHYRRKSPFMRKKMEISTLKNNKNTLAMQKCLLLVMMMLLTTVLIRAQSVSGDSYTFGNSLSGTAGRFSEPSKTIRSIKSKREWLAKYQWLMDSMYTQLTTAAAVDDLVEEYTVQISTIDANPVTAFALPTKPGYKYRLEVVCNGILDRGNSSLEGKKKRGFLVDAGWQINAGTLSTMEPTEYLGSGLTSADYSITNNNSEIVVQATGEANSLITYEFKIKVYTIWANL